MIIIFSWGGFDQKDECQASVGTPPWDECCGLYPERQPYASKGGKGTVLILISW